MRASVSAAWPALCTQYEGRCSWLYLDSLKLPTTGLGYRVVDLASMLSLPWLTKAGTPATDAQKTAEWKSINGHTELAPKGGFAFAKVATLHLDDAEINRQLFVTTDKFWATLKKALPDLETWPADAQLALMDQAWNMGPNFVGPGWPNFTAAAKRGDFTGCAVFCLSKNKSPRDYRHQRLYTNAATVVMLGADPETLWLDRTPSLPPDPTPDPPEEPDVAKVQFRGGWTCSCVATSLPLVEQDMIRLGLIKYNIDIFQLGYNPGGVAASAGMHDEGGCTDVGQYSDAQIKVWREWGWTMQKRVGVGSGTHAHGWPYKCPHLSSGARGQERDWDRKDAGLVGTGRVAGLWPIDDWKTAMKKRLAEQKKRDEAAAEAKRQKELEMPTVKELTQDKAFLAAIADAVLNADVIPNTFTANVDNVNVSTKSALSLTGKRVGSIEAKIDALAAAVAATFPKPTPDPTPPAA